MNKARTKGLDGPMLEVPDDWDEMHSTKEYLGEDRGPCEVSDDAEYVVLETNRYGTLELHPCTKIESGKACSTVWMFSRVLNRWVVTSDESVIERGTALIEKAKTDNVPGWKNADSRRHKIL